MKYSILIPYYKRPTLKDTLLSFQKLYSYRDDYEVVIVESFWNAESSDDHNELLSILNNTKIPYKYITNNTSTSRSCCVNYNKAALIADGEYFIITNPESPHEVDILTGLDVELSKHDCYVVCSCKSVFPDGSFFMWYQHSQLNNRLLHFCSCISKRNWFKINGFCELYQDGMTFEDDDFLERVKLLKIPIVTRDDLMCLHIEHDRSYNNQKDIKHNLDVYNYIWQKGRKGV